MLKAGGLRKDESRWSKLQVFSSLSSNPSFNPRVFDPSRIHKYLHVFGSSRTLCKLLISLTWALWRGRGHRFDPDQVHQSDYKFINSLSCR
jgi:hypothetical protein